MTSVTSGLNKLLELLPSYEPLAIVVKPHLKASASQAQLAPPAVDPFATQGTMPENALAGLAPAEPPEIVLQVPVLVDVAGVRDGPVHVLSTVPRRDSLPRVRSSTSPASLDNLRHLSCLLSC